MGAQKTNKFAQPVKIAEVEYTHFELREVSVDDLFQAELELTRVGGGSHTPLAFNGELMALQLLKVTNGSGGEFTGPFTINLIKQWGKHNYLALRAAQAELDELGEA